MHLYSDVNHSHPQGLYHPSREHDSCGLGFIAHIRGQASRQIVRDGLTMLGNLAHRGAVGADPHSGDGAGIMVQLPDLFLRRQVTFTLPPQGKYACGNVFFPRNATDIANYQHLMARELKHHRLQLLGWRRVPTEPNAIGTSAQQTEPATYQVFVGPTQSLRHPFTRALFLARKSIERKIAALQTPGSATTYICSLSPDSLLYKGMFLATQLQNYYQDLRQDDFCSNFALVHQRFSTNTLPHWKLAHPFRTIAHNGEFNTIQGNIYAMQGREGFLQHPALSAAEVACLKPLIQPGLSDSAAFDNALEFLLHTGRSLPQCLTMMIPEAWGKQPQMAPARRAYYRYYGSFLEPFDGPAAVAAYHQNKICAILDRNGLRPGRYLITQDQHIIFASELGVLNLDGRPIQHSGRLEPGKIITVDMNKGVFLEDEASKNLFIHQLPYTQWTDTHLLEFEQLPCSRKTLSPPTSTPEHISVQQAFGYTVEEVRELLLPMATQGGETIHSMGNDATLAAMSPQYRPLFDFMRQRFAQVTNPAIDPIREKIIMGLSNTYGHPWNPFTDEATACKQVRLAQPILTEAQLQHIQHGLNEFPCATLSTLFPSTEGPQAMQIALDQLIHLACDHARAGSLALVLSDRGICQEQAAIPILLAVAAVHHGLRRAGLRGNLGIVVESAETRQVHHMATLIGYGACAICPYLALELVTKGQEPDIQSVRIRNYIQAVGKGLLKIMSKMGISTLRSYRGAQVFEALGLAQPLMDRYFCGTISILGGLDLTDIATRALRQHQEGFEHPIAGMTSLPEGGELHWRPDGPYHAYNPETIALLQHAVRQNSYTTFQRYSHKANQQEEKTHSTLRSQFQWNIQRPTAPLAEVEPITAIMQRFASGAMSLGSISPEAHENLAIAMNRIGGKSNTGEGGEDPARFHNAKRSAIKQVASGRFGVTTPYLCNADEIQIKIAQGAKPGEGGQLPGHKITPYIAQIRHSIPGVSLISPPPHHDIYSIEDLAQLIFDLKNVNPTASIAVKLVAELGVGTIAAGVAKAHADTIILSGHDGGTGAAPVSSIKAAGIPWELGLAETQQTLMHNGLRSRVKIQVDGQIKTGRDVVIAALLGADEFGFATAPLIAQGCIMMRKCHKGTCPVGIATQDPRLRQHFRGIPEHVVRFMEFVAHEVREIMASLGYTRMQDMVGESTTLRIQPSRHNDPNHKLQLDKILSSNIALHEPRCHSIIQDHGLEGTLDQRLIAQCLPQLAAGRRVHLTKKIHSHNRSTGAMLSGALYKAYPTSPLAEDHVHIQFKGTAGQSFGAFLIQGVTFELHGVANDYVGKGLSGGKIIIAPKPYSTPTNPFPWVAGNTLLYGATAGEAYLAGKAGERFAVRNSGCRAVVEGIGDHGCEYMTGGVVVVLGEIGRNFAAGMSGGLAYLLHTSSFNTNQLNTEMIEVSPLLEQDILTLTTMLQQHIKATGSPTGIRIMNMQPDWHKQFIKVLPIEYKRILQEQNPTHALSHKEPYDERNSRVLEVPPSVGATP
ncbi:MAG: glutamate synthase large subunit [Zetaproteobacteria bacterium]|nr:glutamate synthase large subunit [Zetaproteobacteria bacterium]